MQSITTYHEHKTISVDIRRCEFGLWCLTPLAIIFQLYHGGQFYWWKKPEHPEKICRIRIHWVQSYKKSLKIPKG